MSNQGPSVRPSKEKSRQNQQKVEKDASGPTKVKFDPPVAINKWNLSAVKYALDDTIKKIARDEYSYVENFRLMDQRLVICTIACSFSGFALVYDYLYPFPESRLVLAVCAICYFLMMGVLTLYSVYREENIFMVALEKDEAGVGPDNVWTYQSTLPKYSDTYTLRVTRLDGRTSKTSNAEMERSVSSWFDEEGKIVNEKFFADVRNVHLDVSKSKKDV